MLQDKGLHLLSDTDLSRSGRSSLTHRCVTAGKWNAENLHSSSERQRRKDCINGCFLECQVLGFHLRHQWRTDWKGPDILATWPSLEATKAGPCEAIFSKVIMYGSLLVQEICVDFPPPTFL